MTARKWLKIKDSDVWIVYPDRRVDSPEGCPCDHFVHEGGNRSAGVHFHFEEDRSAKPKRRRLTPRLVEVRSDGTYAQWNFGIFGSYAYVGRDFKEGVVLVPLSTKADREEAARLERMLDDPEKKMQYYAIRHSDGLVHVQNFLFGMKGQHHVHDEEDFAAWAEGIDPRTIHRSESAEPCACAGRE